MHDWEGTTPPILLSPHECPGTTQQARIPSSHPTFPQVDTAIVARQYYSAQLGTSPSRLLKHPQGFSRPTVSVKHQTSSPHRKLCGSVSILPTSQSQHRTFNTKLL